ncbi:hypothetical protein IAR50_006652 [Cryptococcus sp. DSM 104548]
MVCGRGICSRSNSFDNKKLVEYYLASLLIASLTTPTSALRYHGRPPPPSALFASTYKTPAFTQFQWKLIAAEDIGKTAAEVFEKPGQSHGRALPLEIAGDSLTSEEQVVAV